MAIFGDGVPRIKPLVVFCGKGLWISQQEKSKWDRRVVDDFQQNAWVDEQVFMNWLKRQWAMASVYGISANNPRLIVMDVHRAQKTALVKSTLRNQHTSIAMIPPGCTSLMQPLDVVVNAPCKAKVEFYAEQHYEANISHWMNEKYTASDRRILMTKWIADAWVDISVNNKDSIVIVLPVVHDSCNNCNYIRSFKKSGITVNPDGSEDEEINIACLPNYRGPPTTSLNTQLTLVDCSCARERQFDSD